MRTRQVISGAFVIHLKTEVDFQSLLPRPETLLGDTAVAVNPNDERYKDMIGKTLVLPLVHREIPIVADHCYVGNGFWNRCC